MPDLTAPERLDNIIENKTTFTLNNCEFSLLKRIKGQKMLN